MVTDPFHDTSAKEDETKVLSTANLSNGTKTTNVGHREIARGDDSTACCQIIAPDQRTTSIPSGNTPSNPASSTTTPPRIPPSTTAAGLSSPVSSEYHTSNTTSSTQQQPPKRRGREGRRVTWSPIVRCRLIKSHKSFTNEEFNASWYSAEEQQNIAQQCIKEIKMMMLLVDGTSSTARRETTRRKSLVHDNQVPLKYSSRGLEGHTPSCLYAKDKERRLSWEAVFREQERQRRLGIISDEAMAGVCHAMTRFSVARARVVALSDQHDAKLILEYMADHPNSGDEFSHFNSSSHIASPHSFSSWRTTTRNETMKTALTRRRKTRPIEVPSPRSRSSPR